MTSPSSSAAAGLASSICIYYTPAPVHIINRLFYIISRSVGRAVLNFYLAISIIYMLAQCVCYVFTPVRQTVGKQRTPSLSVPLFLSRLQQFIGSQNTRTTTQESVTEMGRGRMWYKGSPLSASTSPLTVM